MLPNGNVPEIGAMRGRRTQKLTILFVCGQNSGRSQIAAAYLKAILQEKIDVRSGGTEPALEIDSRVVTVMLEEGIDLSRCVPQPLHSDELNRADRIVAMGCDVGNLPRIDETWEIADLAGMTLDEVRGIRDTIKRLVFGLAGSLNRADLGLSPAVATL